MANKKISAYVRTTFIHNYNDVGLNALSRKLAKYDKMVTMILVKLTSIVNSSPSITKRYEKDVGVLDSLMAHEFGENKLTGLQMFIDGLGIKANVEKYTDRSTHDELWEALRTGVYLKLWLAVYAFQECHRAIKNVAHELLKWHLTKRAHPGVKITRLYKGTKDYKLDNQLMTVCLYEDLTDFTNASTMLNSSFTSAALFDYLKQSPSAQDIVKTLKATMIGSDVKEESK